MKKQAPKKSLLFLAGILLYIAGLFSGLYGKEGALYFSTLFSPPKVSVIMPTYNRADVLPDAIDSILAQSFTDFEFIIVNDGSTDNTEEIIQKYAQEDNRIVYLKNEKNSGIVHSLNHGLKKARGKYIARMDDDDASFPERLERQVRTMEEHPEITLLGSRIGSPSNAPILNTSPEIENPKLVEIRTYFSSGLAHPTIMIRRDFLIKKGIEYSEKYKYAEDCTLYKDVLNAGGLISAVKEPLLKFKAAKKTNRTTEYGTIQSDSFKGVQQEKLTRLGVKDAASIASNREGKERCVLLQAMATANQQSRIVDQNVLTEMISEECPNNVENAIVVFHPYWKDYFVRLDNKKLERFSNKDKATIISETPTSITIKWDKWDSEIYTKKEDKAFVYKQDATGKIKK